MAIDSRHKSEVFVARVGISNEWEEQVQNVRYCFG